MKLFPTLGFYSGESNDAYVMPFSAQNSNGVIDFIENNYVPVKQDPIVTLTPIVKPLIQANPTIPTGGEMMYNEEIIFSTPRPLQNGVVSVIPIKGQVLQTIVNNDTIVIPSNSTLKVTTMLVDDLGKPIAFANISVNGVPTAQTNESGIVIIPNLKPTDTLTFSYVGYNSQTYVASQIPEKITLKEGSIMLDEVPIKPPYKPKPTKKTNWFLLLLLGGATVYAVNEANKPSEKKPKKITAKI